MDRMFFIFFTFSATLLIPRLLAGQDPVDNECYGSYAVTLLVYNSLIKRPNQTYISSVVNGGILLGSMRRLNNSSAGFNFSYFETDDYGLHLESINGLAGDEAKQTYWELLVKLENGTVIRPDVGVGCYIPEPNQEIIFKYRKY